MSRPDKSFLCLDLGNTTCRGAVWSDDEIIEQHVISTNDFISNCNEWLTQWIQIREITYCSVVPNAEHALTSSFYGSNRVLTSLTAINQSILPIRYPNPQEIGADRIANAIAVFMKHMLPALVIDLGTATTFDVITDDGGYEGGVIIPGPQGMLDYLANQTALLPQVKLALTVSPPYAIGKSTVRAMESGINHGYLPMMEGITEAIRKELSDVGKFLKTIIQTGGEAENFPIGHAHQQSNLTMEGLALAYQNMEANS
jgi:type III pantothenate kinase